MNPPQPSHSRTYVHVYCVRVNTLVQAKQGTGARMRKAVAASYLPSYLGDSCCQFLVCQKDVNLVNNINRAEEEEEEGEATTKSVSSQASKAEGKQIS